jgi:hypothetical protein
MLLSKLKITALLVVVIGVAGTGWGQYRTLVSDPPTVQGEQPQVVQADSKHPKTVPLAQDKGKNEDGKKTPEGKKAGPAEKEMLSQYKEAFLKAFQLSSEIAKAGGRIGPDDKKSADLANFLWEMMEKSYRPPDGKKAAPTNKEALDLYKEAFLMASRISSEIAGAMAKGQAKMKPEAEAALDARGAAFVQAYERAKALKKSLEEQKVSGGKRYDKAVEALDVFLKAEQDFEQAVKFRAKAQAVENARREIENAVSRVKKTAHDQRTTIEALDEIERAVKDMRKKLQEEKERTKP